MKRIVIITSFILSLILGNSINANATVHYYVDVPVTHSNFYDIMYLLEKGVVEERPVFGVSEIVTREEGAVMIAKALKLDGTQRATKFSDIPKSHPNSGYIQSAVEAGIINGYDNNTFRPKVKITRGHMATFISRAFELPNGTKTFKDVPPSHTAYKAVQQLAAAGITTGYSNGTFKPSANLTRVHTAAFLARTLKYVDKNSSKDDDEFEDVPDTPDENDGEETKPYDINLGYLTEDEKELARLINEYRASLGLEPYVISKSLTIVARTHVIDTNLYYKEGQTSENGKICDMHSWSNNGSWKPFCSGEDRTELATGKPSELTDYKSKGYEISAFGGEYKLTPQLVFDAWKNSVHHNNYLIGKTYSALKVMGVGISGNAAHIWFGAEDDPAGTLQ